MSIRYCSLLIACLIAPFCLNTLVYAQDSLPTIYDAAFSSNGLTWGAATSAGFQQYDRKTRRYMQTIPTERPIRFLKWLPDTNRVLLASWEGDEEPTYSILHITQKRIMCSFKEKIRWYRCHAFDFLYGDGAPYKTGITEGIYPFAPQLGHTNSLVFSPDSKEMAYIGWDGDIRVRSTQTGEIIRRFEYPDYHISSIGLWQNGDNYWAGPLYPNFERYQGRSPLLIIDKKDGRIIDTKYINVDGHLIYDVGKNGEIALSIDDDNGWGGHSWIHYWINSLNTSKTKIEITYSYSYNDWMPPCRTIFSNDNRILGIGGDIWSVHSSIYDYQSIKIVNGYNVNLLYHPIPSHPFSPDGKLFMMIKDGREFILVNPATLGHQFIPQFYTDVPDFPLHEPAMSNK